MATVVLLVHLILAVALVGVILIQRSEGGALGGLGGGTFGGLVSARGSANLLTRATAILAACFLVTSLALALLASHSGRRSSILDLPANDAPAAPASPPAAAAPPAPGSAPGSAPEPGPAAPSAPPPATPALPSAPLAQ